MLFFTVVHTGSDAPVDMDRVTVTVMTLRHLDILARVQGAVPGAGEWAIAERENGNDDDLLEPGEAFGILAAPPHPIARNTEVTLKIRPEDAAPLSVRQAIQPSVPPPAIAGGDGSGDRPASAGHRTVPHATKD